MNQRLLDILEAQLSAFRRAFGPSSPESEADMKKAIIANNAAFSEMGMGFPIFPNGMPKTEFMEWLEEQDTPDDRRYLHDWGCIDVDTGEVVDGCPHPELRKADNAI